MMTDMTIEQRCEALLALHVPDLHREEGMLYSVWEDGEVTIEKAGDLFGQRTLHCLLPGGDEAGLPVTMPVPNRAGTHSRIFVRSYKDAVRASALLGNRWALGE
jgi:hypothetical protein